MTAANTPAEEIEARRVEWNRDIDHGTRTVEDAAWFEHQRAMDDYYDDRPTLAELGDDY